MRKKSTKNSSAKNKRDSVITAAIIGLIGTIVTAIFTSPVLVSWLQKTPTPLAIATLTNTTVPIPSATPTIAKSESPFMWLDQPITEKDLYSTGAAKYSFLTTTGLDVTGRYGSDRVWINKPLPENFSATISYTLFEDDCLMYTGFGDGQNVKNSYAWSLYHSTANFYKSTEDTIKFATGKINYVPINQITTHVLERLDSSILLKTADGKVVFRVKPVDNPEWSDINAPNIYWVFAGGVHGAQECTIRYNGIKISEIE